MAHSHTYRLGFSFIAFLLLASCGGGGGGGGESGEPAGKAPVTLIPGTSPTTSTPATAPPTLIDPSVPAEPSQPQSGSSVPPPPAVETPSTLPGSATETPPSAPESGTVCVFSMPSVLSPDGVEFSVSFTCQGSSSGDPTGIITECTLKETQPNGEVREYTTNYGTWANNAKNQGDVMSNLNFEAKSTSGEQEWRVQVLINSLLVKEQFLDATQQRLRCLKAIPLNGMMSIKISGETPYNDVFSLSPSSEVQIDYP